MVGAANYDIIFLNDEQLGPLHNANYYKREVPAGTVEFYSLPRQYLIPGNLLIGAMIDAKKKKYEKLKLDVTAGKVYYVKWHIGKMFVVSEDKGAKELEKDHPGKGPSSD